MLFRGENLCMFVLLGEMFTRCQSINTTSQHLFFNRYSIWLENYMVVYDSFLRRVGLDKEQDITDRYGKFDVLLGIPWKLCKKLQQVWPALLPGINTDQSKHQQSIECAFPLLTLKPLLWCWRSTSQFRYLRPCIE